MDGSLESPASGSLWGIFTFEDAHQKANPWPRWGPSDRHATQTPDDLMRKALLFSSLFQHEVSGGGISNLH